MFKENLGNVCQSWNVLAFSDFPLSNKINTFLNLDLEQLLTETWNTNKKKNAFLNEKMFTTSKNVHP